MRRLLLGAAMVAGAALLLASCGSGGQSAGGPREIKIEVTDAGFVPAQVVIPKNEAVTLVVTRKTEATCATEMIFEAGGAKHDLPYNQTVRIDLPAGQPDTLRYACAMNMIKGEIVAR